MNREQYRTWLDVRHKPVFFDSSNQCSKWEGEAPGEPLSRIVGGSLALPKFLEGLGIAKVFGLNLLSLILLSESLLGRVRLLANRGVSSSAGASLFQSFWRFQGLLAIAICFQWTAIGSSLRGESYAEPPEVVCSVSENEVFVGESITFQVDVQNTENPSLPNLDALKERFEVEFLGDQSRNQSQTMIINGRFSQSNSFSHLYQYQLTAKTPGTFRIPAVTVTIDGKTLSSNSIAVRILEIPKQDSVLVEIVPSQARVYPTQNFTIKLRILLEPIAETGTDPLRTLKQMRQNPPSIQITWLKPPEGVSATEEVSEWLQPLLSTNNVGFSINGVSGNTGSIFERQRLALFDLRNGQESRKGIDESTKDYFVYELERTFVSEKTGSYTFGPAVIKGMFATRIIAIAPPVKVEVSEIPSPRPTNFTGGVGSYGVTASAIPMKLRVGDPMTLNLQFTQGKNSGSLELISAPDLSELPEIAEQFDIVDKSPVGRMENKSKKFAFALRPKRAGVSIPSLKLSAFDPSTEAFVDITTEPIELNVAEASAILASGDLVGSLGGGSSTAEIKTRSEGIFHNVTELSQLRNERVALMSGIVWVGGLWIVSGIAIVSLVFFRNKNSDVDGLRKAAARRTAQSRLTTAGSFLSQGKQKESLRELRAAVMGLVADTGSKIAEGLTIRDLSTAMRACDVPEEDCVRLEALLERIESAEYGASDASDTATMVEEATGLVKRVGPFLERGGKR
ncbi:MAG: BatD family protein [Planctomycetota bacterium]|nr:BatD family protein [Planctomycetota bacterium]